jgi:outer membrane murein-binding lipoprotein Lpp
MRKLLNLTTTFLVVGILAGSLLLSGCTSRASEEEMKALSDMKAEVASLNKEVGQKERDKAALDREVTEKTNKLQQCAKDKEAVKARLQNWK